MASKSLLCVRLSCRFGRGLQRRHVTTSASQAAEELMKRFQGKTVVRKQLLDGNQLQRLSLTLGRPKLRSDVDVTRVTPQQGTPIPPGYHLIYFTPADLESSLGPDGTDQTYNAPPPFTRRMWAGGSMQWEAGNQLAIGDEVAEHTTLVQAHPKRGRDGTEMIFVEVLKEFCNARGLALVDKRSWVFLPPVDLSNTPVRLAAQNGTDELLFKPSQSRDLPGNNDGGFVERHMRWSPVGLFRFSALTFNAHMIHYNDPWTKGIEGHPNLVVHGPLNLINMLDYWGDQHHTGRSLTGITYRATAPIYAGQNYVIGTSEKEALDGGQELTRITVTRDGTLCMKGEVTSTAI